MRNCMESLCPSHIVSLCFEVYTYGLFQLWQVDPAFSDRVIFFLMLSFSPFRQPCHLILQYMDNISNNLGIKCAVVMPNRAGLIEISLAMQPASA